MDKKTVKSIRQKYIIRLIIFTVLFALIIFFIIKNKEKQFDTPNTNQSTNEESEESSSTPTPSETANENNASDVYYYNQGLNQFNQQEYSLAVQSFEKAIQINPNKDEYYNKKSQSEMSLGNKQAAINTIKLGLTKNANSELLKSKLDVLEKEQLGNQEEIKQ